MLLRLLSKAATEPYPSKPINRPEGFRGRIAIRDELCIGCHRCFIVCPTTCIEMVDAPREVERKGKTFVRKQKPIVHLLTCIRCGLCEEACPTEPEAIYLTEESSGSYTDEDVIVE
jgi:NADH-quinone oxidoreductase subunit I